MGTLTKIFNSTSMFLLNFLMIILGPIECHLDPGLVYIKQILIVIISKSVEVCHFILFFCLFEAAPMAYGGSQARGLIGAVAAGLRHSHSNTRSEPRLRPTLQLEATPDP